MFRKFLYNMHKSLKTDGFGWITSVFAVLHRLPDGSLRQPLLAKKRLGENDRLQIWRNALRTCLLRVLTSTAKPLLTKGTRPEMDRVSMAIDFIVKTA